MAFHSNALYYQTEDDVHQEEANRQGYEFALQTKSKKYFFLLWVAEQTILLALLSSMWIRRLISYR